MLAVSSSIAPRWRGRTISTADGLTLHRMAAHESRLDYVVHVPDGARTVRRWSANLREPVPDGAKRAVGHEPEMTLDDFDERPGVCRTRITLAASDEAVAKFREISFTVDRNFADMLRPRDVMHIAQSYHDGVGVSVLRSGALVAAAGAVSAVPLGDSIVVRRPAEAGQVHAIYRARDPLYEEWEVPVQIETALGLRLLHRGRGELGGHDFFVVHGFVRGIECVAISLLGVCPDCAATLTAPLLTKPDAIRMRWFHDPKEQLEAKVLFALESARFGHGGGQSPDGRGFGDESDAV